MPDARARVRRALVPCGGRGTRMLGLTRGAPKEMIAIAGVPAVEWVARECASSGIEELLVVIAPGKEAIVAHLTALAGRPGIPARIVFAMQMAPRGLGDAMRLGRDFAEDEPFGVVLPDNLFVGEAPGLAQVIEEFAVSGTNTVAIVKILASEAARRGPTSVVPGEIEGNHYRIAHIPDKGERTARFDTGGRASAFTNVGRYVFTNELFDCIEAVEQDLSGDAELDDVPILQRMLANGQLAGRIIRGRFLDLGLPEGHAEAERLLGAEPQRMG